jgi:hypothetical protein
MSSSEGTGQQEPSKFRSAHLHPSRETTGKSYPVLARAGRPARPCPTLRREPLSFDRLLFLTKVHTSASAPTIDCTRGTGSQSTDASRRGTRLRCRRYSIHSRRCRTISLPCRATSRTAGSGCAVRKGLRSSLHRDPKQRLCPNSALL